MHPAKTFRAKAQTRPGQFWKHSGIRRTEHFYACCHDDQHQQHTVELDFAQIVPEVMYQRSTLRPIGLFRRHHAGQTGGRSKVHQRHRRKRPGDPESFGEESGHNRPGQPADPARYVYTRQRGGGLPCSGQIVGVCQPDGPVNSPQTAKSQGEQQNMADGQCGLGKRYCKEGDDSSSDQFQRLNQPAP